MSHTQKEYDETRTAPRFLPHLSPSALEVGVSSRGTMNDQPKYALAMRLAKLKRQEIEINSVIAETIIKQRKNLPTTEDTELLTKQWKTLKKKIKEIESSS